MKLGAVLLAVALSLGLAAPSQAQPPDQTATYVAGPGPLATNCNSPVLARYGGACFTLLAYGHEVTLDVDDVTGLPVRASASFHDIAGNVLGSTGSFCDRSVTHLPEGTTHVMVVLDWTRGSCASGQSPTAGTIILHVSHEH